MPALQERLNADLKDALRAGDTTRRDEIRGLIAMLKTEQQSKLTRALTRAGLILHGDQALSSDQAAEADRLRATVALDDTEEQDVLLQRVKQHRQSIDSFTLGKRADLIQAEEAQLAVAETYLPAQLGAEEIDAIIRAAIQDTGAQSVRDQGKVMGQLSARLRGRADMKVVASRVQQLLGQAG
jgi:uncharacterized protein YqeY